MNTIINPLSLSLSLSLSLIPPFAVFFLISYLATLRLMYGSIRFIYMLSNLSVGWLRVYFKINALSVIVVLQLYLT